MIEQPRLLPDEAPIKDASVTFVALSGDGLVFTHTIGGKRQMLAESSGPLWAVWTGRWRSDLFVLDRERAVKALS